MAVGLELQAHSFRGRAHALWAEFSKTVVGDIFSTLVALSSISLLFLACAYAIVVLAGVVQAIFRLLG